MIKKSTKVFNAALSIALSTAIMMSSTTSAFALSTNSGSSSEIGKYTTTSTKSVSFPTLKKGSQGFRVQALQYMLNYHVGAGLTTDGVFGDATEKAVIKFQNSRGIKPADGIVKGSTWTNLTNVVQTKSSYSAYATKAIQVLLNNKISANLSVDGIYGTNTENAVKRFQKAQGIDEDGKVGPETWNYLFH
ncbi:MAG: peptidoglycan-binding protein [Lachnospiraceae bacterium]|nr:peptidoglycan-binding protein [Lachnospiraceae bacterium]